jgi:hypothetical protein
MFMKNLAVVFIFGLLVTFAMPLSQADEEISANEECLNPMIEGDDGVRRSATPYEVASDELNVFCCCNTYNGTCCNEVGFCSGFVPGCVCSGVIDDGPNIREGARI